MSDLINTVDKNNHTLILPSLNRIPELKLQMSTIIEAEQRLIEAKTVNPITYADLEHCFNESYRSLKQHLASIGFQINQTEKVMEQAKAEVFLSKYPEYFQKQGFAKSYDNSDLRKAFLMKDEDYLMALDRLNQLKALESHMDGKLKVIENVSRYMKKQIDLLMRSGLSNRDLYSTIKG